MLSKYVDSPLTAEEYLNTMVIREDGKLPLWYTQGIEWAKQDKVKGFRISKQRTVRYVYKDLLLKLLMSLGKDSFGMLNPDREEVTLLEPQIQNMYNSSDLFYENTFLETLWRLPDTAEIGVYGWDSAMSRNTYFVNKIVHTNTKEILKEWMLGNFNCKNLSYYTTDTQEYLKLIIERNNLNLNYKIIEGLPPEKVSVVKKNDQTSHLKFHMAKWQYVCDWEWRETIEQRTRKL